MALLLLELFRFHDDSHRNACIGNAMKMVLALPYERKDEFKQKYGKLLRWNPEDKVWTWVGREGLPEDLKEFLARSSEEGKAVSCWS
jgi:hypothetical protein